VITTLVVGLSGCCEVKEAVLESCPCTILQTIEGSEQHFEDGICEQHES
jgi:hypothetical protein